MFTVVVSSNRYSAEAGTLGQFGRKYVHDAIHLASGLAGARCRWLRGRHVRRTHPEGPGAISPLVAVAGFALPGGNKGPIGPQHDGSVLYHVVAVAPLDRGRPGVSRPRPVSEGPDRTRWRGVGAPLVTTHPMPSAAVSTECPGAGTVAWAAARSG